MDYDTVEVFSGELVPVEHEAQPLPMRRTEAGYQTAVAVQRPRSLEGIYRQAMTEAERGGEACYWAFPVGGRNIEGPSIGLAMILARLWGNCAVPTQYYETKDEWVFEASFVDLETGFTITRVFRAKKGAGRLRGSKMEQKDPERAQDMAFQAAQSRAIRNVVLAGLPSWLVSEALERARESALKKIDVKGIRASAEAAIKFMAGYGVDQAQMEALLKAPWLNWGREDILKLQGIARQLKEGQVRPEEIFPAKAEPEAAKVETEKMAPAKSKKGKGDKHPAEAPRPDADDGKATDGQVKQIKQLAAAVGLTEADLVATCAKHGAAGLAELPFGAAEGLIVDLEAKAAE